MVRCAAFSLCEFLVALGLAVALLALAAEGIFLIKNFQIFNLAATRDLLCARYFLEVECPQLLRKKKEANDLQEEFFFAMDSKEGVREISKQEMDSEKVALLVRLNCEVPVHEDSKSTLLPIRLRFERYLQQGKRRTYEIHGMVFLF